MPLKTKNITKHKKGTIFNWSFLLLLSISFTNSIWSQNKNTDIPLENKTIEKTDAEKSWEYLNYMKSLFVSGYEEQERYKKLNLFEAKKYTDKIYLNRSRLAQDFLNKYPSDPHFDKAFNLFYNVYFIPTFIQDQDKIPEEQFQFLSKFPRRVSIKELGSLRRALPINKVAKEQWLHYGNELVENFLTSNTSLNRKAMASTKLISRDFLLALSCYGALTKEPMETDYWAYFDTYYWGAIKQRLYDLMNTYPDFEDLTTYILSVLNILKKEVSPKLARSYMEEFYLKTEDSHPLSDHAGIKALHQVLGDNLAALDAVKEGEGTKPIDMVFTSMDGREVDLSKMRGKVILIDFWSISCGPCIKEMPHVQVLYDKYRDQGLEVLGIAREGDAAKDMVLDILKKTGANWPQRLDTGKDASVSLHSLYNITGYPTVWLLDKQGNIVDRNARLEQLEPLIRKYLEIE
ncbi:MAG: TlpA disulfide reductase family protein [Algibacter sp.]